MTSPSGHTPNGVDWKRFSIVEQLANVGSEVDRTIRAHQTGNTTRFNNALDRALSLFDLTAADPRWAGHRRREVLRAREDFCRLFFEPDPPAASAEGLRRYFLAFGVAANARSHR
jgi:hypothetical protein